MTDLSSLSDQELMDLLHRYAASPAQAAPTRDDRLGAAAQEQPSLPWDVAQSTGIGLVKGGIGLAGMGGDTRELHRALIDQAERKQP